MHDPVIIEPYNSSWPMQFEALAQPLRAALGPLALSIEHIGSTSVPQLPAKPIIDIDIVISSRLILPQVTRVLEQLGYTHHGDQGIVGREVFKKRADIRHHLYVCAIDAAPLHEHLLFRDFLRANPQTAGAYGDLKAELAQQHRHDREAYTEAKGIFVQQVLGAALETGARLPKTCLRSDL